MLRMGGLLGRGSLPPWLLVAVEARVIEWPWGPGVLSVGEGVSRWWAEEHVPTLRGLGPGVRFLFVPPCIAAATSGAAASASTSCTMPASPVAARVTRSIFQKGSDPSSSLYREQSPTHPPCQSTHTSASGCPHPTNPACAMRWRNAVVSHSGSGLGPVSQCLLHPTGDCPLPVLPQHTEASWDPGWGQQAPRPYQCAWREHKHCL